MTEMPFLITWGLPPVFNSPCRADFITISAMQTMLLVNDDRFHRNVDTFLRALGVAELTADTFLGYIITIFRGISAPEGKTVSLDRLLREIEPLACSFINLEDRERTSERNIGINLFHVRILSEQIRQKVGSDFFDPSLHRYCHAEESAFALHCGEGDMLIGLQALIKAFALGGQEI